MRNINQYQSKVQSVDERMVCQIDGDEALVERNGFYSIKSYRNIGQARVAFYRGVDEKYDPEYILDKIYKGE